MPRHASELENTPLFLTKKNQEAPVSVGLTYMTVEDGKLLDEMTRVLSPQMVNAVMIGGIYSDVYGSMYVRRRVDLIKRIAVAKDGERVKELIQMVDAGGNLPSEYYADGSKRTFQPLGVNE